MALPEDIVEILTQDPGNALFIEYAEHLKRSGRVSEALHVCLAGLSANPAAHQGRFFLARTFYELGYVPFAIRELKELVRAMPEVQPLRNLLLKLEPEGASSALEAPAAEEQTVAENEFDITEIELVGEKKS